MCSDVIAPSANLAAAEPWFGTRPSSRLVRTDHTTAS
jgi:hypothetical protein